MTCEMLSNSVYLSKPERRNSQWAFMHFHFCVPQKPRDYLGVDRCSLKTLIELKL